MPKVNQCKSIPEESLIGNTFGIYDYNDVFSVEVKPGEQVTIDFWFSRFGNVSTGWMKFLMKLRNFMVGFIGLKTGEPGFNVEQKFVVGSRYGIFKISARNDREIVFGENDRHLNFESSLLIKPKDGVDFLYSITVVRFNNVTGRIYFFFVKPFHKLIIRTTLKRVVKNVAS